MKVFNYDFYSIFTSCNQNFTAIIKITFNVNTTLDI